MTLLSLTLKVQTQRSLFLYEEHVPPGVYIVTPDVNTTPPEHAASGTLMQELESQRQKSKVLLDASVGAGEWIRDTFPGVTIGLYWLLPLLLTLDT